MKVIVIGGKGTAIDIGEQIVNAREQHNVNIEFLGWAVDDESLGSVINGYPVLCKPRELAEKFDDPEIKLIFSLYKTDKMEERVNLLASYGITPSRFANFVHPLAYMARSAVLGVGNVILSHATIFSNVKMGDHNIIYTNSVLGHDTRIGNNNFLASAVVGSECRVGDGVFMGMMATVRGGVEVGNYALVGAGSNVLNKVEMHQVVVGNPARPMQK